MAPPSSLHSPLSETIESPVGPGADHIYPLAEQCKKLFDSYLGTPKLYSSHVLECRRRFLTWLSFLEVLGGESTRLDKRLQYAPEIKGLVLSMLGVLQRNLKLSIDRHTPTDASGSETSSLDDVAKCDVGMYGIVGAVDRLNRLAIVIRRFLSTSEGERVLDFATKQTPDDFRRIISLTIQFLYPTSAKPLRAQLIDSIVYRRQRILWCRRKNQQPTPSKGSSAKGRFSSFSLTAECPAVSESPGGKSIITCSYCLKDLELPKRVTGEEKESLWRDHLRADLMPYVCVSEECCGSPASFCFATPEEWTQHMFEYHHADWAQFIHRVSWHCPKCSTDAEPYLSADLFVRHLDEAHRGDFSPALTPFELTRMSLKSKTTKPRETAECPLCGPVWSDPGRLDKGTTQPSSDLHDHFIRHLLHLALLSFSWWDDDTGISTDGLDDGGKSMAVLASHSQHGGSITGANDQAHSMDFFSDWELKRATLNLEALELKGQQAGENLKEQSQALRESLRPLITGSAVEAPYISDSGAASSKWLEVIRSKLVATLREALETRSSGEKGQSLQARTFSSEVSAVYSLRLSDWVVNSITNNLQKSEFTISNESFLPEGLVHQIITPEAIVEEFPTLNPTSPDDVDSFDFILSHAKKSFAIAIHIGFRGRELWKVVQLFRHHGFNDTKLPIALGPQLIPKPFVYSPWTAARRRYFFSAQWKFLAPIFLPSKFEYTFQPSCILPITKTGIPTEDSNLAKGTSWAALNQTKLARIHPSHLRSVLPMISSYHAPSDKDHISIAINETRVDYRDPAQKPFVEALESRRKCFEQVSQLNHPHLIGVFATFKTSDRAYMLFDHPDKGNLYDIWAESPASPHLDSTLVKEVLVQMRGLSDAIVAGHDIGIDFGVLTPKRIFSFPNGTRVGKLKMLTTNFVTSSGRGSTQPLYLRHEAPEVAGSREDSSGDKDIWAMGCIILQWVIYLLYGYEELRSFAKSLCDRDSKQGFFFAFDGRGRAVEHPVVMRYLVYMERGTRCRPGTAFRDLINLMRKQLIRTDVNRRPTASELRNSLDNMLGKAEGNEDYLYATKLGNGRRLGPSAEEASSCITLLPAHSEADIPVLPRGI
ncbi:protein kinase [Ilyonectria robusta]